MVVILLLPDRLFMQQRAPEDQQKEALEVVIEPPEPQYVEVNPEGPENEPDTVNNYSFRSQQAADENPEESSEDMPDVAGEADTRKIVQGSAGQPEPPVLESGTYSLNGNSDASENPQTEAANPVSPVPPPPPPPIFTEKPVPEGPGSSPEFSDTDREPVETTEYGSQINLYQTEATEQDSENTNEASKNASQAKPLPRKRVQLPPDLTYGQLMRSKGSVGRRGSLAIDATFSQFGEYEQQFYAAVQSGWYREIEFFQPIDTSASVKVRFRIKSDGEIEDVTVLNTTAGEVATLICQAALTKLSPFRPWTEEMVQVFGQEREIEIVFNYL